MSTMEVMASMALEMKWVVDRKAGMVERHEAK